MGLRICPAVAAPPSPLKPAVPVPAIVVMMPSVPILADARVAQVCDIQASVSFACATARGVQRCAALAGPPSPLLPQTLAVPAMRVSSPSTLKRNI